MDDNVIDELTEKIKWLALYSQLSTKKAGSGKYEKQLTNSQISFLKYIKYFDSPNMGKLAQIMKTTSSFSSQLTTQLEDRGFVKRVHKPEKRKEVFVTLTVKGERALDEIEAPEIDRRKKIIQSIDQGFGTDGIVFVNKILNHMIQDFKNEIVK